jgi:hypothetical protein
MGRLSIDPYSSILARRAPSSITDVAFIPQKKPVVRPTPVIINSVRTGAAPDGRVQRIYQYLPLFPSCASIKYHT